MGLKQTLEKRLTNFGKNNSPTLVAMSIAAAKGIFRPTFTMMDTKESYETKRYTAIREGLTEVIAIPVYYLSGVTTAFLSKKLAIPKHFMSKKTYQKYITGDKSDAVLSSYKHAEELAKINLPKITTTSAFAGVCISALFVIPYVCSATIKPIMQKLEKSSSKENNIIEKTNNTQVNKKSNVQSFKAYSNYNIYKNNGYGMKVGGL